MAGLAPKGTIAAKILAALSIFPVSSLSTHLLSKDRIQVDAQDENQMAALAWATEKKQF